MFPHESDNANSPAEYSTSGIFSYERLDISAQENGFHQAEQVKGMKYKKTSIKRIEDVHTGQAAFIHF